MMKFLVVFAAIAALAYSAPGACEAGYIDLPLGTTKTFGDSRNAVYWCFEFTMSASGSNNVYVSLRRRVRFNNSLSSLFFCTSVSSSMVQSECTSADSSYSFYTTKNLGTVYGRADLDTYGIDQGTYIKFDIRKFSGTSASAWSGYCPQGNCDSRGACFSGSCDCDYGHSACDVAGLLDWIIYLIVVCVIVIIVIPIVIIICCCCCGVCCAAAAAAH